MVRTDITGDVRRQVERRIAIELQADLRGAHHHLVAHRRDVRGFTQLPDRQAGWILQRC